MNLHENTTEFYDTLLVIANSLNISPSIIEKDYYVTLFLESLVKKFQTYFLKEELHFQNFIK